MNVPTLACSLDGVTFARRVAMAGLIAAAMCLLAGCGTSKPAAETPVKLPPDYVPIGVGRGPGYQPGPLSAQVRAGRPVDGLLCGQANPRRFGAHLEIFARNHVVAIPAGIGTRPPVRRENGRVTAGRCRYPLITADPTGVLEIAAGAKLTLGQLFDLWGQSLSRRRIGSFTAPEVVAYVGTQRWTGDPRAIPLSRHARVVLEIASHVLPHRVYLFPPGL